MVKSVVTIGTFDGVHRGHQRVLAAARREARRRSAMCLAYAFDIPPRAIAGGDAVRLLLPPETKRRLLARQVDRVAQASFGDVGGLTPDAFVRDVLRRELDADAVVVGKSFRFGVARSGDPAALASLAAAEGMALVVVPSLLVDGVPASSTRIRSLLEAGDVERAARLLGRPPLLRGDVVAGDGIGRTLGFPTANLSLDPRVLIPKHGVYLSRAYLPGIRSLALTYVGERPTVMDSPLRCEVHLLDAPGRDLRANIAEVHLYRFLRGDLRFASLTALRDQMRADLEAAHRDALRFPDAADPDPFGG